MMPTFGYPSVVVRLPFVATVSSLSELSGDELMQRKLRVSVLRTEVPSTSPYLSPKQLAVLVLEDNNNKQYAWTCAMHRHEYSSSSYDNVMFVGKGSSSATEGFTSADLKATQDVVDACGSDVESNLPMAQAGSVLSVETLNKSISVKPGVRSPWLVCNRAILGRHAVPTPSLKPGSSLNEPGLEFYPRTRPVSETELLAWKEAENTYERKFRQVTYKEDKNGVPVRVVLGYEPEAPPKPAMEDISLVEDTVFIVYVTFHLRLYVTCEDSRLADLDSAQLPGTDAHSALFRGVAQEGKDLRLTASYTGRQGLALERLLTQSSSCMKSLSTRAGIDYAAIRALLASAAPQAALTGAGGSKKSSTSSAAAPVASGVGVGSSTTQTGISSGSEDEQMEEQDDHEPEPEDEDSGDDDLDDLGGALRNAAAGRFARRRREPLSMRALLARVVRKKYGDVPVLSAVTASSAVVVKAKAAEHKLRALTSSDAVPTPAALAAAVREVTVCTGSDSSMTELIDSLTPSPVPLDSIHPSLRSMQLSGRSDAGQQLTLKPYQVHAIQYMLKREDAVAQARRPIDHPWEEPARAGSLDVGKLQGKALLAGASSAVGKKRLSTAGALGQAPDLSMDRSWLQRFMTEIRSRTLPVLVQCGPLVGVSVQLAANHALSAATQAASSSAQIHASSEEGSGPDPMSSVRLTYSLPFLERRSAPSPPTSRSLATARPAAGTGTGADAMADSSDNSEPDGLLSAVLESNRANLALIRTMRDMLAVATGEQSGDRTPPPLDEELEANTEEDEAGSAAASAAVAAASSPSVWYESIESHSTPFHRHLSKSGRSFRFLSPLLLARAVVDVSAPELPSSLTTGLYLAKGRVGHVSVVTELPALSLLGPVRPPTMEGIQGEAVKEPEIAGQVQGAGKRKRTAVVDDADEDDTGNHAMPRKVAKIEAPPTTSQVVPGNLHTHSAQQQRAGVPAVAAPPAQVRASQPVPSNHHQRQQQQQHNRGHGVAPVPSTGVQGAVQEEDEDDDVVIVKDGQEGVIDLCDEDDSPGTAVPYVVQPPTRSSSATEGAVGHAGSAARSAVARLPSPARPSITAPQASARLIPPVQSPVEHSSHDGDGDQDMGQDASNISPSDSTGAAASVSTERVASEVAGISAELLPELRHSLLDSKRAAYIRSLRLGFVSQSAPSSEASYPRLASSAGAGAGASSGRASTTERSTFTIAQPPPASGLVQDMALPDDQAPTAVPVLALVDPLVYPSLPAPLPKVVESRAQRAIDHPLWQRASLVLDMGSAPPPGAHSSSSSSSSAPSPSGSLFYPCCYYFYRPGEEGALVRDRCARCINRPVLALPAAVPKLPRQQASADMFDGVRKGGILSDEVGLGKTAECIGLIVNNPHSPQPFFRGQHSTGTRALAAHIIGTPFPEIRTFLRENARLTTQSSVAYRAGVAAAHGVLHPSQTLKFSQYMCADPYRQLSASEDHGWVGSRATLVIGTSSIAGQWVSEVRKWAPQLAVVLYPGQEQAKQAYFCSHADSWVYWPSPLSGAAVEGRSSAKATAAGNSACQECLTRCFQGVVMPPGGVNEIMHTTLSADSSSEGSGSGRTDSMVLGDSQGSCHKPNGVTDYAVIARDRLVAAMATADIVVATWDQLEKELKEYKSGSGLLRKVFFHRIILDEVQVLEQSVSAVGKGRAIADMGAYTGALKTRIMVAKQLEGAHRWAVSSTPLSSTDGLYDILDFLRHRPFADKMTWSAKVEPVLQSLSNTDDIVNSVSALGAALSSCLFPGSHCPLHTGASAASTGTGLASCTHDCYYCDRPTSSEMIYMRQAMNFAVNRISFRTVEDAKRLFKLAHSLLALLSSSTSTGMSMSCFENAIECRKGTYILRGWHKFENLEYKYYFDHFQAMISRAATVHRAVLEHFVFSVVRALPSDQQHQLLLARARLRSFFKAAEQSRLVNSMGAGMQMVRYILQPMLWRNKKSIVQATGQLSEVKVQDVAVLIELSQAERHVHDTLLKRYQDGVIAQLKAWIADNKGRSAAERILLQATRAAEQSRLLMNTDITSENFSGSGDLISMCSIAEQGIRDLQAACAHLEASTALAQRLGMIGLQGKPLTLRSIMESMVAGSEEELQKAAIAVVDAATQAACTAIAASSEILALYSLLAEKGMGPGHNLGKHPVLGNLLEPDVAVQARLQAHNDSSAPEARYSWPLIQAARLVRRTTCESCFPVHPSTGQPMPKPTGDRRAHAQECGSLAGIRIKDMLASALKCAEAVPAAYHLASSVLGFALVPSSSATINPVPAGAGAGTGTGGSGATNNKFEQFLTIHAPEAGESVTKDSWAEVQIQVGAAAGAAGAGTGAGGGTKSTAGDQFAAEQSHRHIAAADIWKNKLWKLWRVHGPASRLLAACQAVGKGRMDWQSMQGVVNGREMNAARNAVGASGQPGTAEGVRLVKRALPDLQQLETKVHSYEQLLPGMGSKVRFRSAALEYTEELQELWEAKKAGRQLSFAEQDALACVICTDDLQEGDVVLMPCCHRLCQRCFYKLVLHDRMTPQQLETLPIAQLKAAAQPDMEGKCPTCRAAVRPRDVHKIEKAASASAAASAAASVAGAGAGAGAASVVAQAAPEQAKEISVSTVVSLLRSASSEQPSSEGLFIGTVTTAQANAVQLSIDAKGHTGANSIDAGAQPGHADASVAYGGKIACLIRRIRALPAGEKCVVATSYPQLTKLTAEALVSEGIRAAILTGVPTEKTRLLEEFARVGPAVSSSSSASLSSSSSSDSPLRVLVLSTAQDSAGMNLTCANHLFIMDPVLDEGVIAQLRGRIDRQGQSKPCTVYHIAVAGTVEERIIRHRERRKAEALVASASSPAATGTDAGAGTGSSFSSGEVGPSLSSSSSKAGAQASLTPEELLFILDGQQGHA